jgi:hypothetical protein
MRWVLACALLAAISCVPARAVAPDTDSSARAAAPDTDPAVTQGLQLYQTESNGLEACLGVWLSDKPKMEEELLGQVGEAVKDLGVVEGAEIVATQRVSQRVERYFIAVYYARRPLWLSLERYALPDKTTTLSLKFSTDEDRILPSYLTDVQQ